MKSLRGRRGCRSLLIATLVLLATPLANASAASLHWSMRESVDPGHSLNAISCPSATLCIAVDGHGQAVTSTAPAGGAGMWTRAVVDGSSKLIGVSCATTQFCVAIDNHAQVLASKNPIGGAGAWVAARVDPGHTMTAISCPSRKLCVAVDNAGGVISSTNPSGGPAAWKRVKIDHLRLVGISCASSRLCTAIEGNRTAARSTHPSGGATAWKKRRIASGAFAQLLGVSCPSTKFCVATDLPDGATTVDALSSTQPTSKHAWRDTSLDDIPHEGNVQAIISCASTQLCVVVDFSQSGTFDGFVSTHPAGGSWSSDNPPGPLSFGSSFNGISCTSGPLCVIVDSAGDVVVGT